MKRGYGEILKNAREKKGLKHSDAQKQLKITEVYLKAMEDEDEDVFEKPVYIRMFLKTYAKFLKVDDREIIELYESDPEGAAREKAAKKVQDDIAAGIRAEIADEPHEAENKAAAEKREKTAKVEKLEFSIKNKYRIIGAGLFLIIAAVVVIIMSSKSREQQLPAAGEEVYTVPAAESITVVAKGKDEVWMKARHDNGEEEFFLKKGEEKRWKDITKIVFLVGNAAGVEFIADGDSIGSIGEEGEVINGLVFQAGKNWHIDRGQGFRSSRTPATPVPTIVESGLMY